MGPKNILEKFFKKGSAGENYLSIILLPNQIVTCVWTIQDDLVRQIGYSEKHFQETNNLIHQAAVAIDEAAKNSQTDVEKTVFGLSHYWLEDGQPSPDTAKILKDLTDDLDLDAQAFIPIASSINHLEKIQNQTTPFAIVVGKSDNFCEVHLLENNEVTSTKIARSQTDSGKIVQLIEQIGEEKSLPPKIIIFGNDKKLEKELTEIEWGNVYKQPPEIESLDFRKLIRAVAYAQAADVLGHEPQTDEAPGLVAPIATENIVASAKPLTQTESDEFGFVEGEDILVSGSDEEPQELEAEGKQLVPVESSDQASERQESKHPQPLLSAKPHNREDYAVEFDNVAQPTYQEEKRRVPKTGRKFRFPIPFSPHLPRPLKLSPKKLGLIIAIFFLTLVAGSYVAGQTLTQAEVIVKVNPKQESYDFETKISPNASYDLQKSQIPGQSIATKVSGTQKAVTSGSKTIGEKAKGEVNIFNWTGSSKNFAQGTVIINKDGLKFTLEESVEATSASAPSASQRSPGKAKAKVAAEKTGQNYNVGASQDFTFSEFDELFYSAQNEAAFTGGDEKKVTVISKEDQDRLDKSLTDSLVGKAKAEIKSQNSSLKFHDEAVAIKINKKEFDKKIDDEASLLNLNMEVEATNIAYSENDLKKLLAEKANANAPQNLKAREEDIEISNTEVIRTKDGLSLSGRYRANFVPAFNEEELKSKIAGKSIKDTRDIIKSTDGVSEVELKFTPALPLIDTTPRNKSKIKFTIETI